MRTTTSLVGLLDMSIATVRRQFYDSDIGPAAAASLSFTRLCGPRPVRSVDTSYPYVGRDERTYVFIGSFAGFARWAKLREWIPPLSPKSLPPRLEAP
jgi:hypothetical protein